MSTGSRLLRSVIALLIAFTLHAAFASALEIRGARPNLSLLALLLCSLFLDGNQGALLGLLAGLLEGSYLSIFLGSYLVTRTLAGFAVGALEERIFRDSPFVALLAVLAGSVLVELCFFVFAPQPDALRWVVRAVTEGLYNAVLAMPAYILLRRLLGRREAV